MYVSIRCYSQSEPLFADEASVTVNGYRVIPKKFSLSAYQMILGSMGKNLLNAYTVTIGVTVFGTLLSVLISAAFAYVLTVREFKPKGALNMFLYIPMILFPQDFCPGTSCVPNITI